MQFLDARVSRDGSRSCATCHPGGGTNGETYRDGEPVPAGDPGGRNVPALRAAWETAPYLWDGSLASVKAAVERALLIDMGGSELSAVDLDALSAYVLSIPRFDSGRVQLDGTPTEPATLSARLGFGVFLKVKCDSCHSPPSYSHPSLFDVGTGGTWSVPTLRGVSVSAPYGHDGRWSTLEDAIRASLTSSRVELSYREIRQLVSYLRLL